MINAIYHKNPNAYQITYTYNEWIYLIEQVKTTCANDNYCKQVGEGNRTNGPLKPLFVICVCANRAEIKGTTKVNKGVSGPIM